MISSHGSPCTLRRKLFAVALLALTAGHAFAQAGSVAAADLPTAAGASDDVKKTVAAKGSRVTLEDGWAAEFWFARALATASNGAAGALYPDLSNGQFVAVVTFAKGTSDFRGQAIPAGTYTLRYQYLPQDANHMGVSPNPDFLLAIPLAADANPADNLPFKKLVALSSKATGTEHPAVLAMAPAGTPNTVAKDDQGMTIFTAEVATSSGKTEKILSLIHI